MGSNYWQKRFQAVEAMQNQTAKNTVQSITPAFDKAQAQIEKEINAWYARFAKNNQISLLEAKKLLNTKELKEFRWDVQEYIKYGRQNALDQKWMKELENASARFHISRLEALKVRTQQAAEVAFGNELDQLDSMAAKVYMDDYYHTAYEIQRGLGVGFDVAQIDQNKLRKIIDKPWTADKMTFSDRIWKSKTQLIDSLHKELTQMCVLGKAPDQTISAIAKRMNVSKGQAGRLVMTEAAYFGSAAQKDCFNDLDVEKFEIVATLDSHTSEICQDMDGQVFDMKDFEAGVTAPPFHVWCRSCTCPWFEDNDDGTRAARGADGKTYQVPASMKYEDWKEHFVDKTKDPADWLKKADVREFKEITDALDFGYGNLTQDDYNKWWDDYEAHNSGVHLSKEELQTIDDYTEGGFIGFNDVSRYTDAELLKKKYSVEDIDRIRKKADILEGALSKYDLDTNIVTHRFERDVSWLTGNGNSIEDLEKLIGTEYTTTGFTSSGMLPNRFRFTGGKSDAVHFEIVTPKGTNGAFLSMSKKGENEFLYNRNTRFRVLDGGERIVKEQKMNFKTWEMEEVEITERFLKVQVIPDGTYIDDIVEEVKEIKKAIKLEHDMFPASFTATKAEAKNTQMLMDYVNDLEGANPDTVELYSKMRKMENIESEGIEWTVKHGEHSGVVKYWESYSDGKLAKAHIAYPKLTGDNFAGQVQTTLHEQMHLMDMYLRTDPRYGGKWFSSGQEELLKFFKSQSDPKVIKPLDDFKMSDKVKKLFADFDDEYVAIHDRLYKEYREISDELRNKYWKTREISASEYKKLLNKAEKEYKDQLNYQHRNIMGGGVGALQDIYDAVSGGRFRDATYNHIRYGHGSAYYRTIANRCEESLANYGALSVTNPDLIELLREDYPELVDGLEKTVKKMLEKVGE
jgi:SPP1 gp7 family putative phage head morphogenesis protein